jgi:hypothetical protein
MHIIAQVVLFVKGEMLEVTQVEAAPTPPGCRAWEPGLLDKIIA